VSPAGRKRPYRMRKRAEQVDETRQRIAEATLRLHTTLGPAGTTISAVAEKAGVSRGTVYRHFANQEELYVACMTYGAEQWDTPDPGSWPTITDLGERARHALEELYRYFEENVDTFAPIYRDIAAMPTGAQRALREEDGAFVEGLLAGCDLRGSRGRRLRGVAAHLVDFRTWHSLRVDQGLDPAYVVELASQLLLLAAGDDTGDGA
jgi:AcrR family transcriptional regulator